MIDLNFYPEDHGEEIAVIPYVVADCDLTGWDFRKLVESILDARLLLWAALYEVDDDGAVRAKWRDK